MCDWFDDGDDERDDPREADFFALPGSGDHDPADLRAAYGAALDRAFRALGHRHAKALAFNDSNGNHSECVTGQHRTRPCPCCPQCLMTAVAMLRDRRGRARYRTMSWTEYYRSIAAGPGQSSGQWVEGGEDRLAPRLGLPANPRQAITRSTKVRQVLALRLEAARVDEIVACLAVAAVLARRRAFDGDHGSLPLQSVATELNERGELRRGGAWTSDEVRQALQDAALAVADAWYALPTQSRSSWRLLRRLVFRHLHGDDSVERIVARAGREPENLLAAEGQPAETRTGGGVDVPEQCCRRVCPRLARRDTAPMSPEQRLASIRRLVLADLKVEDTGRTLPLGPAAKAQRGQDVEDAVVLVAMTFAEAEFHAELQRCPDLSAVPRHQLRQRCYAAWGLRLADR